MRAHWISRQAGLAMLALAWIITGAYAAAAQPADYPADYADEDVQSSFSELDRHGRWIEHPEWGSVWVPDVDDDWRPYTVGRWVFTDEHGWYWDSEEPFGWAVYHYGRWIDDREEGWIWIPGTEWGPAWVAWRYGEEAVGWTPLPPDAVWEPGRGLYLTDSFYHGADYAPFWIFVAPRYLLSSGLHRYVSPVNRNPVFFARTRPSTHYGWEGRRVFNHGIARHEIERLTRTRVPSLALQRSARPLAGRRAGSGAVFAYRPAIVPSNRWQAGRSGDWRRFEPAARPPAARSAPVRIDREFAPRRDFNPSFPSRIAPDVRRDRDNGTPRNDGGRLQRPHQERAAPQQDAPRRISPQHTTPERRTFAPPPPSTSQEPPRRYRQEAPAARTQQPPPNSGGRMQRTEPPPQRAQRAAPTPAPQQHQPPPQAAPRRGPHPGGKKPDDPAAPTQGGHNRRG